MSRALNDELAGGVATKRDVDGAADSLKAELDGAVGMLKGELDGAVGMLRGEIDGAVVMLRGEIAAVDTKVEVLDAKFDALDAKFEGKFAALEAKFDTQGRYVFLVLALIAALGLYNAAAPRLDAMAPAIAAETSPSVGG